MCIHGNIRMVPDFVGRFQILPTELYFKLKKLIKCDVNMKYTECLKHVTMQKKFNENIQFKLTEAIDGIHVNNKFGNYIQDGKHVSTQTF